jgi:hypothetical protein
MESSFVRLGTSFGKGNRVAHHKQADPGSVRAWFKPIIYQQLFLGSALLDPPCRRSDSTSTKPAARVQCHAGKSSQPSNMTVVALKQISTARVSSLALRQIISCATD